MATIKLASTNELEALIPLFSGYQNFYKMPASESRIHHFLEQRLKQKDSFIWLATYNQNAAGFVQVYPAFSTVAMRPLWLLNDLFVAPEMRTKGIARALLEKVHSEAKQQDIFSVKLATQTKNHIAQALYLSLGYKRLDEFEHYSKKIN